MYLIRILCTLIVLGAAAPVSAQAPAETPGINYDTARNDRRLTAMQAQGPIALDGRLDEASWAAAPLATNFTQNDPREGAPATFETEVKLLYDHRALYIGVFARDPSPGDIIINELRKDFNTGSADGFQVVIDTFNDDRNGFQFAINPAGAKWDSQMSNEGREQNSNWDGIWDVSTRIGDDGGTRRSKSRSRRSSSVRRTCRRGASTSSAACAAEMRTATGPRCGGFTRCRACRWPAATKGCRG